MTRPLLAFFLLLKVVKERLLVVTALGLIASVNSCFAVENLPPPPFPHAAKKVGATGTVTTNVAFDQHGAVNTCSVVESSGSDILDRDTLAWIKAHWHSDKLAGTTQLVPVQYTLTMTAKLPEGAPDRYSNKTFSSPARTAAVQTNNRDVADWDKDFAMPQFTYLYLPDTLVLSILFDKTGRVADCSVAQSCGNSKFDSWAAAWAKAHWHHEAYSNQKALMSYNPSDFTKSYPVWRSD